MVLCCSCPRQHDSHIFISSAVFAQLQSSRSLLGCPKCVPLVPPGHLLSMGPILTWATMVPEGGHGSGLLTGPLGVRHGCSSLFPGDPISQCMSSCSDPPAPGSPGPCLAAPLDAPRTGPGTKAPVCRLPACPVRALSLPSLSSPFSSSNFAAGPTLLIFLITARSSWSHTSRARFTGFTELWVCTGAGLAAGGVVLAALRFRRSRAQRAQQRSTHERTDAAKLLVRDPPADCPRPALRPPWGRGLALGAGPGCRKDAPIGPGRRAHARAAPAPARGGGRDSPRRGSDAAHSPRTLVSWVCVHDCTVFPTPRGPWPRGARLPPLRASPALPLPSGSRPRAGREGSGSRRRPLPGRGARGGGRA